MATPELKRIYKIEKISLGDCRPGDVIYVREDKKFMIVKSSPAPATEYDLPGSMCEGIISQDIDAALEHGETEMTTLHETNES